MRFVTCVALVSMMVASVTEAKPKKSREEMTARAESEITKLNEDFAGAWNSHDAKAMAAYWAEDGDLINPVGRHASGREEIEKLITDEHSGLFKSSTFKSVSTKVRLLHGGVALCDEAVTVTGATPPPGGPPMPTDFHITSVLIRKDKKWLITCCRPVAYPAAAAGGAPEAPASAAPASPSPGQ